MLVNYSEIPRNKMQDGAYSYEILKPDQTVNGNSGLRLLECEDDASIQLAEANVESCYYLLSGRGSISFSTRPNASRWIIESDTAVWVSSGIAITISNSGEGPFRCLVAYCKSTSSQRSRYQVLRLSDAPTHHLVGFISKSIFNREALSILGATRCVGIDLETITPLYLLDTHSHDEEILFVLRGKGNVTIKDSDFPIKPGSMVYTGPHLPHSVHNTSRDNMQYLVFEYIP